MSILPGNSKEFRRIIGIFEDMKRITILLVVFLVASCTKTPQLERRYEELPLGAIKPEGWLRETLIRQRDGITKNLDETYPQVVGPDNGWLGGEGDRWERGPYWVDGMLPLAYILDDDELKAKAQKWVDWTLENQREDGFIGPDKGYPYVEGLQRGMPLDWWPRIVMLKVLQQYYNATGDLRVLDCLGKYFKYQLQTLPKTPLDTYTFWAKYRAGDNLDVVLWYYNLTWEPWLLKLADLLHEQSFDFTGECLEGDLLSTKASIHCVNLAQGLKEPVVYWQYKKDERLIEAVYKGLQDIERYNGFPNGMFGGDEALHGNDPRQGSELCSAVELMYSYEQMLKITGVTEFADMLERVAFNALPAQTSSDFTLHQYFQKPNQAQITYGQHNFDVGQEGTGQVFGFLTAYPCCLTNQHQGWPKFTQDLWYRIPDGGLAAMVYSPCTVTTECAGARVTIEERTAYPMDGLIEFVFSMSEPASFPLELRIPEWAGGVKLTVNGKPIEDTDWLTRIEREWHDGDIVRLELGMEVKASRWYENSVALERGPLVYALGLGERWKKTVMTGYQREKFGDCYWEVFPTQPWNYGLMRNQVLNDIESVEVEVDSTKIGGWPWTLDAAPVRLKVRAARIASWQLYGGDAGPLPWTPGGGADVGDWPNYPLEPEEIITLVPYGCTKLRISEFPVL
jgi:hypothetical protein